MTNQSPAEALRQQILSVFPVFEEELQYGLLANIDKPKVDRIMELVTAYAATVEREALERIKDEKEQLNIERVNGSVLVVPLAVIDTELDRLAALQGPPDGSDGHSEPAKS